MAVLIEGANIIIKKEVDSVAPSFSIKPNGTLVNDGQLMRIGFLSEENAVKYANELANDLHQQGVKTPTDYIAYVLQGKGIQGDCDWLESKLIALEPEKKVEICWLKDAGLDNQVATPEQWKYEGSLSQNRISYDKKDFTSRHTHLRTEGSIEVWLDTETGEEVYIDKKS